MFFYGATGTKYCHPGDHMFYIGLYKEKHEKIFLSETTGPRALSLDIWYVASPSGRSNYGPGAKIGPVAGVTFYIGLYRKTQKIFLSETIRPRALIFGMKHHLVDLYQFC